MTLPSRNGTECPAPRSTIVSFPSVSVMPLIRPRIGLQASITRQSSATPN